MASGDLVPATFDLYRRTIKRLLAFFGDNRSVVDIQPTDFGRLRANAAKTFAPSTLRAFMTRTRSVFRFAITEGWIDKPVQFGAAFRAPSAKVLL